MVRLLKDRIWPLLGILGLIVLSKLILLVPPIVLGQLVDQWSSAGAQPAVHPLTLVLAFAGVSLAQAAILPLQITALTVFVQGVIRDASTSWSIEVLGKEFDYFEGMRLGQLMKGFERGIEAHEKLLTFALTTAIPLGVQFIAYSALIIVMSGIWAFLLIVATCAIYLFATRLLVAWRRPHIEAVNDEEDNIAGEFATLFSAAKTIKLENAVLSGVDYLSNAYDSYARAAMRVGFSGSVLTASQALILGLGTSAILAWGLVSASSGEGAGQLVVLVSVSGLLFATLAQLGDAYRFIDQFRADNQQIALYLGLPDFERSGQAAKPNVTLRLEATLLSIPSAPIVLLSKQLIVPPRQKVAIIGPSGAGKTTLLEALAGTKSALRGSLFLDNVPVTDFSSAAHLSMLRYCPQAPTFLHGDILQSVFFGVATETDTTALNKMGLHQFSSKSSRLVSEGAGSISGGEAKRLSLLRLVTRPGTYNIFDEPTASLDEGTAMAVWDVLLNLPENAAVIVATHDLTILPKFDRVLVMADGQLIGDGTYEDLLQDGRIADVVSHLRQEMH